MKMSMKDLVDRVAETISRYNMFERGHRIGVAVSGGADSVCLLQALVELRPRWALALSVLHLDHCLRGEASREDACFVREMAERLGLPFHMAEVDVGRLAAASRDNLEQAARRARREFLLRFLSERQVDRVALGHTRSDQAETVLLRLLRGSGAAGISGILPVTSEGFVRPLLDINREQARAFLQERGVHWREDTSNQDLDFARNRVRHVLLPALERDFNPALSEVLARMATLAQDEELYWNQLVDRLEAELFQGRLPVVLVRAVDLASLGRPLQRRLIRRAIERARGDLRRIEFSHVERVRELAAAVEGDGRVLMPGVDVMRSFEWIRFAPMDEGASRRNWRLPLPAPGRVKVPGNPTTLVLEILETPEAETPRSGYNTREYGLDWSRISGPLELRNWRPGDRYRPLGLAGEDRIKTLFQKARVPLWERRNWPVITRGDTILWSRRFGPAAEFAATGSTRRVLKLVEVEDSGNPDSPDERL